MSFRFAMPKSWWWKFFRVLSYLNVNFASSTESVGNFIINFHLFDFGGIFLFFPRSSHSQLKLPWKLQHNTKFKNFHQFDICHDVWRWTVRYPSLIVPNFHILMNIRGEATWKLKVNWNHSLISLYVAWILNSPKLRHISPFLAACKSKRNWFCIFKISTFPRCHECSTTPTIAQKKFKFFLNFQLNKQIQLSSQAFDGVRSEKNSISISQLNHVESFSRVAKQQKEVNFDLFYQNFFFHIHLLN